jgi:hypothetical protein
LGRTIAAISLGLKAEDKASTARNYSINVGEIAVSNDSHEQISPPSSFAIEESQVSADGTSAQLRLTWDFDPKVWYYDIHRRRIPHSTKNMMWLGRISCDCYYISSMPRVGSETSTVLQLVAVSAAGTETPCDRATARFSWK